MLWLTRSDLVDAERPTPVDAREQPTDIVRQAIEDAANDVPEATQVRCAHCVPSAGTIRKAGCRVDAHGREGSRMGNAFSVCGSRQ